MRTEDIVRQSVRNLLRHRGRTMLTVLGVIVGCCAVVIMVSIGIGMKRSTDAALSEMGDLTAITVQAPSNGKHKLDAEALKSMEKLEHVSAAIPKITTEYGVTLYAGDDNRYVDSMVTVVGESLEDARKEGYNLTEGDWEKLQNGEVLIGEYLAYAFVDTKRPDGSNYVDRYGDDYDYDTGESTGSMPEPFFDATTETLTLVLSEDPDSADAKSVKTELKVGGVMEEDWNRGYETSEGILMDLDTWEKLLDQYAALTGGKKQSATGYSSILIKVDDISNVSDTEAEIQKLGYQTSSMDSIREPIEQEARQKQLMLGGIGAVSLFVAALGIANTMIMSITERTREIGVMKALGCFLADIRKIFLLEAGCIGLIGGVIGVICSYLISWIMNLVGAGAAFSSELVYTESTTAVSVIPWWLALFAVLFSILVGVAAGYYPADKAVRVSALEAIRHE